MATDTKHPYSELTNEELKAKEKRLRSEISKLGSSIEDEREELDRLKTRLRKGDRSVKAQIEAVEETINDLQGERSKKRARLQSARRKRQSSSSSSASKASYNL